MAKGYPCPEHCKEQFSEQYSGEGNPFFGKRHTEEAKSRMSKSKIGKYIGEKNPMFGLSRPEVKKWRSGENSNFFKGYWVIDGEYYTSLDSAASNTEYTRDQINYRVKAGKSGFSFEPKENRDGKEANR